MKFRYLISLAVATALLTGCNNEDDFWYEGHEWNVKSHHGKQCFRYGTCRI